METVNIEIDEKIENQAMEVFDERNLTLEEAIHLFLQQVVLTQAIPFPLKIPNVETIMAINENKDKMESFVTARDSLLD